MADLFELTQRDLEKATAAVAALESKLEGPPKEFAAAAKASLQRLSSMFREVPEGMLITFKALYANDFRQLIRDLATDSGDEDSIFWLVFYLYALARELQLLKPTFNPVEEGLFAAVDDNYLHLPSDKRMRVDYLRAKLPFDLLARQAHKSINEISEKVQAEKAALDEPAKRIEGWTESLEAWERRVRELEVNVRGQAEHLNFVGLSQAFANQIAGKKSDKRVQVTLLILTGLVLLVVPLSPLWAPIVLGVQFDWKIEHFPRFASVAVLELVLLYFFRVFLKNYYSAKAQLLQLELRHSLCAFVQSYSEFIAKLRKDTDGKTLDRFEALVFSGI